MSLEQALADNSAAIRELIAAWSQLTKQAAAIKAGGVPLADVPKPAPTPTVPATDTPTPKASVPAEAVTASPSEVTYEQVSKAITAKARADREGVVALLGKFGAKKGTELKPEQYADFLKALA